MVKNSYSTATLPLLNSYSTKVPHAVKPFLLLLTPYSTKVASYSTNWYTFDMLKNKNGEYYDEFRSSQIWHMVDVPPEYSRTRSKLPDSLIEKRRAHMVKMYEEGTPMAWIAKLYEYDKAHVSRIIRGIPNN